MQIANAANTCQGHTICEVLLLKRSEKLSLHSAYTAYPSTGEKKINVAGSFELKHPPIHLLNVEQNWAATGPQKWHHIMRLVPWLYALLIQGVHKVFPGVDIFNSAQKNLKRVNKYFKIEGFEFRHSSSPKIEQIRTCFIPSPKNY